MSRKEKNTIGKEYKLVGRYTDGKEITGYHLQTVKSGKINSSRVDRETMAYLVGHGKVVNCTGQLYKDKVVYRGVGMEIKNLPVMDERIRHIYEKNDVVPEWEFEIIGQIVDMDKHEVVGYTLRDRWGKQQDESKFDVESLAWCECIINARVINKVNRKISALKALVDGDGEEVMVYNGDGLVLGDKWYLEGVNCDLGSLPVKDSREKWNKEWGYWY